MNAVFVINAFDVEDIDVPFKERLIFETLVVIMMKFSGDYIKDYDETMKGVVGMGSYSCALNKLDLDVKNRHASLDKSSIKEPLILEKNVLYGYL